MNQRYFYCDYPTDDSGGSCKQPVPQEGSRRALKRCKPHGDRLPYWPAADANDTKENP